MLLAPLLLRGVEAEVHGNLRRIWQILTITCGALGNPLARLIPSPRAFRPRVSLIKGTGGPGVPTRWLSPLGCLEPGRRCWGLPANTLCPLLGEGAGAGEDGGRASKTALRSFALVALAAKASPASTLAELHWHKRDGGACKYRLPLPHVFQLQLATDTL